ncbi:MULTISPECIES: CaiB/BaiF CoA transferase family protein [unclassified Sphingobium]|uniref:CaiB/BaiF CoA transferase family protein n=1 Tax=unclassified Sphingobium TaxID=2611147 RepID=UPI00119ACC99|nr:MULTISPECIES: CoA transferase [unclassified Sphingobium]MBG6119962.1 crotonobetainyl-CoA:carnitine CoA-transferase CaiB-like acyl-CoA transferase [Sphingobium sp. JAI105]TWC99599.1 crotonobetainyl-CoA:carnitine CoA-transferase CaiB-like acyl-CoA transferase [Sphingobium sp. AEW010]TWD18964.1 crotonobetainyl-CoA:carnitine CoA-transferase CaiB-like acyl-CoA transferase [Sphingobium sp. AEW013]TWD21835.1 crotonobetainyl-CoA:carnitine CoA-transferase CaiB-like acyl-CoA transferase [Sphingobium s
MPVEDIQRQEASALSGVRVLDLSRLIAGPYAAQLLGDLGAEVIKVEKPGSGDDTRASTVQGRGHYDGQAPSPFFESVNRNKRSIAVDLRAADGQQLVRDLAARADVLIENFRAGTLARYGLDEATLRSFNPRLIYCSVTGYGQSGPKANAPGVDPVFQAQGGLMSAFVGKDGSALSGRLALTVTDLVTGQNAASSILAALYERERSGVGQYIDVALLDSTLALMSHVAQHFLITGDAPRGTQLLGGDSGFSGIITCADGALMVVAVRQHHFEALVGALGKPELALDKRFATRRDRGRNAATLQPLLDALVVNRQVADVAATLEEKLPVGIVNDIAAAFDDPQAVHRGLKVDVGSDDRLAPGVASPLRLTRTPPAYHRRPPALGEHSMEILRDELRLSAARSAQLVRSGVVA